MFDFFNKLLFIIIAIESIIIFILSIKIGILEKKNKRHFYKKLTELNNTKRIIQKEAEKYNEDIQKAQNSNDYINIYNDILDNIMSNNTDYD